MPELKLKTEISLGSVLAILSSAVSIFYFVFSLGTVNQTQAVEIDNIKVQQQADRGNIQKIYEQLYQMNEKLNILIGRVDGQK